MLKASIPRTSAPRHYAPLQSLMMGDFNYPAIDWAKRTAHSSEAHHFLNILQNNFMGQLAPTRDKALLDRLITNNTDLIVDVGILCSMLQDNKQDKILGTKH